MEEGMIYIMFNSEGKEDPDKIDTVFRFFWVDAPSLRLSVLDSFIVSEKLETRKWDAFYSKGVLLNKTKDRYHQEVSEPELDFLIDGTWEEGYSFKFDDKN